MILFSRLENNVKCKKLYLGHDILMDAQQAQILRDRKNHSKYHSRLLLSRIGGIKMEITLANFQLKAIADLIAAMEQPNRDIVLKSCTGSGKTIILTHFMDEYFKSNHKTVFIWLTPGKGEILKSRARKRWIDIFMAVKQNCFQIL